MRRFVDASRMLPDPSPSLSLVARCGRAVLALVLLISGMQPASAIEPDAAAATPVAIGSDVPLGLDQRDALLAQIRSIGRRGFLFEVARPAPSGVGSTSLFLYGTVHLGAEGSEPFNGPLLDALRRSRRIAIEADPTDGSRTQQLALALGRYDDGDSLSRHVSPDLMTRLTAFSERHRMSIDHVGRMKPWLLANMIVLTDLGGLGLDPALGSEMYLIGFARGMGIPIVEIEGIETQLRLLADVPDTVQVAQLDEALGESDDGSARLHGQELFGLWKAGDRAAGDAFIASMRREADGKLYERYFFDTLIDARNRRMADRAEDLLHEPGDTFFAVGALHLFGETGLMHELERRGYRIIDLQAGL